MKANERLKPIVEEIEYLLAKRRQLAAERVNLILDHGHSQIGTKCLYG
jgi:hypothetical protein